MEIDKTNRNNLKGYFQRGKIPTQQNFAEFIEASLNQAEDGIVKKSNESLSVQAYKEADSQSKLFKFFKSFEDQKPAFTLSLNAKEGKVFKNGLTVDNATTSLLFVDEASGNIGIRNTSPAAALDINGSLKIKKDGEILFADNGQIRSADNNHRIIFNRAADTIEFREFGRFVFSPGATAGKATSKLIIEPDGDLRLNRRKISFFTNADDDVNHAIYNNYGNLDAEGRWDGIKMNVYAGLDIRTGNVKTKQHKSILFVNGNGVGIGTKTPDAKLHVVGDQVFGIDAKNKRFIFHSRTNANGDFLQITPDDAKGAWNWSGGLSINRAGNVGVRVQAPSASLDVNGTLRVRNNGTFDKDLTVRDRIFAANSDIYFTEVNHNYSGYGGTTGYAAIENAKNYGALMILGRTTDKGRIVKLWDYLQVIGNLDVTGASNVNGTVNAKGGVRVDTNLKAHLNVDGSFYRYGNQAYINVDDLLYIKDSTSGIKFRFDTNNGRLHVGGSAAEAPLTISGNGKENTPNGSMHITSDCILFGGENSGKEVNSAQISAGKHIDHSLNIVGMSKDTGWKSRRVDVWAEGGFHLQGNSNTVRFTQDSRRLYFYIKTSGHGSNRMMSWDGDSNWDGASDAKLKTNIEKEGSILDRVLKLEVVNYNWKDNPKDRKSIGMIAQDVQPHFPSLVGEMPTADGKDSHLTLKYATFGVLAVGAIKELKQATDAEAKELRGQIELLTKQIQDLQKKLDGVAKS